MKKNLLKIWVLSLALLSAIFLLNTNAASEYWTVKLEITGTSGYCAYGLEMDFLQHAFSYNARTISGQFFTTGNTARWYCVDSYGVASWALSIQSSNVLNITTNNPAHTIPASSVKVRSATGTLANGTCTIDNGDSDGVYVSIDTSKTLFGKSSALGEACEVGTDEVRLSVDLTWSQAIGQYSGTLTINVPSL